MFRVVHEHRGAAVGAKRAEDGDAAVGGVVVGFERGGGGVVGDILRDWVRNDIAQLLTVEEGSQIFRRGWEGMVLFMGIVTGRSGMAVTVKEKRRLDGSTGESPRYPLREVCRNNESSEINP